MSTEREPTVIERLVAFHWNTLFHESGPSWANVASEKLRQQQTEAMLAAVRELRSSLSDGNNEEWFYADASDVIQLVIEDHERRAGGKGE